MIITGNNFSVTADHDRVEFNGVTANQLTVIVPAGATTGPITVTTNGAAAVSSNPFTVNGTIYVLDFSAGMLPASRVESDISD